MTAPPRLTLQRVRAIVFDLDGTLIDSYRAIASSLNHARQRFGMPPLDSEAIRMRVGRGLGVVVAELVGTDRVERAVLHFREHYARVYVEETSALPGVRDTLERLHRAGFAMAVASNKPACFSRPILDSLGMLPYLTSVQGPDLVASHKPDPAMIHRCLEELAVGPAEAVYVGDMVLDVESAARAGLPLLLVPGGSSTPEQLQETEETVLSSFTDLLDLLPRSPDPAST